MIIGKCLNFCFFFFNETATTEIYTTANTLSLHDALPISPARPPSCSRTLRCGSSVRSTRSEEHTSELQSLAVISYAVFCLKKKKKTPNINNYVLYLKTKTSNKQNKTY